eukprot:UN06514
MSTKPENSYQHLQPGTEGE